MKRFIRRFQTAVLRAASQSLGIRSPSTGRIVGTPDNGRFLHLKNAVIEFFITNPWALVMFSGYYSGPFDRMNKKIRECIPAVVSVSFADKDGIQPIEMTLQAWQGEAAVYLKATFDQACLKVWEVEKGEL